MKRHWLLLLTALGVVAYLATGLTQVRPGERLVVRRLGRVLDEKPGPGLFFGLPWGVDCMDRVAIDEVRRVTVGYDRDAAEDGVAAPAGQFLTGDHNLVDVQVVLNYTVDEDAVADYVAEAERVDGLLTRAAESGMAEWLASRTVDDVLITAKAALPRALIAATRARLAPCRLGVRLQDATVVLAQPPDQVKPEFDRVTRAQTSIRTQVNQAEQSALRELRQAESRKTNQLRQAEAYAAGKRLDARAEAAAFLARLEQYRKLGSDNPGYLAAIWHEEMGKLFTALKAGGKIDLLDHHMGADGLDFTQVPGGGRKK